MLKMYKGYMIFLHDLESRMPINIFTTGIMKRSWCLIND